MVALVCALIGVGFWVQDRASNSRPSQHATEATNTLLRLNGKTEAVRSHALLAPSIAGEQINTLTVVHLAPAGAHVNAGDVIAEFDREAQLRNYLDKQAEATEQTGKLEEAQAKEIEDKAKDQTEIEQAESRLDKARLEMKKVEILSRIDAEKAREELDEADVTLTQLRETYSLKRKAASASIRILEIQRDRTRGIMEHAKNNAELMQIRSPLTGIVVYNTIWKQGTMGEVKEGDQVRAGTPFMEVVDPSTMEVQAPVNQQDILRLTMGEDALVRLDAYPDLSFHARLRSVDPIGRPGDFSSKVRTYAAIFAIDGNDRRLMPDLSTAVEVRAGGAS